LTFGYFIAIILSGLNAIDHGIWFKRLVLNASFLLLFIVVSQSVKSKNSYIVAKAIIIFGVLFSVLGILDLYFYNFNRQIFDILHSFDSSNIDGNSELASYGLITRARGFANEANEFSQYLIIPFGFILAELALTSRSNKTIFYLIVALVIVLFAQLASLSRGGLLGFMSQVLFLLFIKQKYKYSQTHKRSFFAIMISIITIGSALVLIYQSYFEGDLIAVVLERVFTTNSSDDWTTNERLSTIYAGLDLIQNSITNFIFGVGAGNLDVSIVSEATTTNQFIDIFAETGVIGLVLFSFFVAYLLINSSVVIIANRTLFDNRSNTSFVGSYLSFIGMLFGGLTYSTHALFFFWLIAGLLTSFTTSKLAAAR
jgi:O-antigen ligase